MKRILVILPLLILMPCSPVWSQQERDEAGEESTLIEGKEYERTVPVRVHFGKRDCALRIGLEYYQKNTDANVRSTVSNETCGASEGSYVLRIRFRRDSGESEQVEFEETWSRDDDSDVVIEKLYPVGSDLQVTRISTSRLKCTCAEPAESPAE